MENNSSPNPFYAKLCLARWAVVFLCVVFCLRFFNLDQDLPSYGVGMYNPADEGLYATIAMNLYNFGEIDPSEQLMEKYGLSSYTAAHFRNDLLISLPVYAGLCLFGDNYFGMRMGQVCISLVNLLLIGAIIRRLCRRYGNGAPIERWLPVCGMAIFTVSFPYLIASRVVEPSLLRMTFLLLIFYLLLRYEANNRLRFGLMGFAFSVSVLFVYITSVIFLIPIIAAGCMEGRRNGKKAFFDAVLGCLIGGVAGLVLSECYYRFIWGSSTLENMMGIYGIFSGRNGYEVFAAANGGLLRAFAKATIRLFSMNGLLMALPLLFGFIVALPGCILYGWKKRDEAITFALTAVLSYWAMTIFSDDFVLRKGMIILPFILFIIVFYLLNRKKANEVFAKLNIRSGSRKFLGAFWNVAALLSCVAVAYYRFFSYSDRTVLDFQATDKWFILLPQLLTLAVLCICMIWKKPERIKAAVLCCVIGLLLCNGYMTLRYVLSNPTYTEKEMMISLGKEYDGAMFGYRSIGATLYNDLEPIVSDEHTLPQYLLRRPDIPFFDQLTNRDKLDWDPIEKMLEEENRSLDVISIYQRSYEHCADKTTFAVYRLSKE